VTAKKFGVASQYLTVPSFSGRSMRLALRFGGNNLVSKTNPAFARSLTLDSAFNELATNLDGFEFF
jgi:hypothetical protein